ncbi:MAG: family 20 glycosylhydrolase [Armatimonadia bacterium]
MQRLCQVAVVCAALLAMFVQSSSADRWADYGDFTTRYESLEPTPQGDGHLGSIASGQSLQVRFPIPAGDLVGYWVSLSNVVGMSGQGSSYQLLVRRDSATGPVVYQGPTIANGDEWNATNRTPIDLTDTLTEADRARGYLDLFATGIVTGDGWTLYRNQPGRPIYAYAAIASPELTKRLAASKAMQRLGVSVIPQPREMRFEEGSFKLAADTHICYPATASEGVLFAARELHDLLQERTGLDLRLEPCEKGRFGHINLGLAGDSFWPEQPPAGLIPPGNESYLTFVDDDGAFLVGPTEQGCLYAAMTVGQLARKSDGEVGLPHCTIRDWPAFPYRIIQYDVARGQTINVDYVKRVLRELARCKINAVLFYMEDDFKFRKYPFLGREGTFTHEKAAELSAFAKPYHVQLIPQFESLGHASAVLGHPEMKEYREAGGSWVFCTSEPKTWEFLDDVYTELLEAFPSTEFIHVGADEFEGGFGKCPACSAKVAQGGYGLLYSEHMNKLNQLVKKHGKTMMFWPSHGGPTPALSYMTLQYQDLLEKDCIPTEWIYHGPSSYPQIEQYQKAGFKDVHCCPAVVGYSRIYPDYRTTFRGISGFYKAGEEHKCGGAYCTTWEFMHGALIENSWYGLIYSAECAWNPESTPKTEFNRRFADEFFGLRDAAAADQIESTISDPLPMDRKVSQWRNLGTLTDLIWCAPNRVIRDFAMKQPPALAQSAGEFATALEAPLGRVADLSARASTNKVTLQATGLALQMMSYAAHKLEVMQQAGVTYRAAADLIGKDSTACAAKLQEAADGIAGLGSEAGEAAKGYRYFVDNCGAYLGDWDRLNKQSEQLGATAGQLRDLQAKAKAGTIEALPAGETFGFVSGTYTRLGEWVPAQMSETGATVTYDVTKFIKGDGPVVVEWEYTRGAHGVDIVKTELLCDGKPVAEDTHKGWSGGGTRDNTYTLQLKGFKPGSKYEVAGLLKSNGGTDSRGTVWMVAH